MAIYRRGGMILALCSLGACTTIVPFKEIKHIGFEEQPTKGKSIGQIEGNDCVWMVAGYWLGGQPSLTRAMANASKGKKSTLADVATSGEVGERAVRYMNNVSYSHSGFNAYVIGKQCLEVKGEGYK